MAKEAIIIPGNKDSVFGNLNGSSDYGKLVHWLDYRGMNVHAVEVDWSATYPEWVDSAVKQVEGMETNPDETVLIGFSFGSLIALGVSNEVSTKGLALGSVSPHGGVEGMARLEESVPGLRSKYTPEQYVAFEGLDVPALVAGVTATESVVLFGGDESDHLKDRCWKVATALDTELVEIAGVSHDIEAEPYADLLAAHAVATLR